MAADNSRGRSRPAYMLIFGELLSSFNNAQPKYAPGQRRISPPKPRNFTQSTSKSATTTIKQQQQQQRARTPTATPSTSPVKNNIRARASPASIPTAPSATTTRVSPSGPSSSAAAAAAVAQSAASSAQKSSSARTSSCASGGGGGGGGSSGQASAISKPGDGSLSPALSESSIKLSNKTGISSTAAGGGGGLRAAQQFREFSPRELSTGTLGPLLGEVKHPASEQFNHSSRIPISPTTAQVTAQQQATTAATVGPQTISRRVVGAERSISQRASGRSVSLRDENQQSLEPEITLAQRQLQQLLAKTQNEREELQGPGLALSENSMGQKQVIQSKAQAQAAAAMQIAAPRSPAQRPTTGGAGGGGGRSPRLQREKKNPRDSGPAQGLSQTPVANVGGGGSGSFEMKNVKGGGAGGPTSPVMGQKRVSLSKIIAEQTPDAFQTLGPGFHITAPGEKSKPQANGEAKTSGTLDAVPSDYEHIFHYPSNIAEEPTTTTQQQHHNKGTNANRKHHGKHHAKHQQDKANNNKR